MPDEVSEPESGRLTFIQRSRRTQLVGCAIEVLADEGYAQASLVRIARRAEVSRGVISYHFTDRDALIEAVVHEVYDTARGMIRPSIEAEPTAAGAVRAFITGSAEFYRTHPAYMAALQEVINNARADDGTLRHGDQGRAEEVEISAVSELLVRGQRDGEFRDFPPRVMARTIRHALNGLLKDLRTIDGFDARADAEELATLFERAMAKDR